MRTNTKPADGRKDTAERLAGGFGFAAAKQGAEGLLRRAVMANLLWEDTFYEDGESVADNIKELVPQVPPSVVAKIAIEARTQQKLRHVPLLLVREMARHKTHRGIVGETLPQIILRADELAEFLSIYWRDGKTPISAQVKKGLAAAFGNFNEYQFAKYNRDEAIKLRDVLFLTHPHPAQDKVELYKKIAENKLATPDTWEVALSGGKDKKETWERLLAEKKLGALAFLRNLRNMEQAKVSEDAIRKAFKEIKADWLLPLNFLAAAEAAPRYERELETMMLEGLAKGEKLPGHTVFVVDVSGSMSQSVSGRSNFNRLHVACAMAMLAAESCESISVYATAGDDPRRQHDTDVVKPRRGFALIEEIRKTGNKLGGGGIFTRQMLEYIKPLEPKADRVIIFSDSQDCDLPGRAIPKPFAPKNYIIDVSAHKHGVNYKGVWTAEVSGWSEHFLDYIRALEGLATPKDEEEPELQLA